MYVAAVTGTNGKTTTVEFIRQLLGGNHNQAASVGTLGIVDQQGQSPPPFVLSDVGCWRQVIDDLSLDYDYLALEAYSAGLSSRDWDDVPINAAALTTFGRDHLDFHGSVENYANAKLHLFQSILPSGCTAVVNTDCPLFGRVVRIASLNSHRLISYGTGGDVYYQTLSPVAGGQLASICVFGTTFEQFVSVSTPFLAENALAAFCISLDAGMEVEQALIGLGQLQTPSGRMQALGERRGTRVFVDFAHTPDALQRALQDIRLLSSGQVRLVFGCGGDRDATKRPAMGAIADRFADVVVVTDDNPRSECPSKIRAAITEQCPGAVEIANREQAIRFALDQSRSGDVVLICGRGSEATMTYADHEYPWCDLNALSQFQK
ncbi:MAG: UDP-N-acetylmuramyl-tripeptide synthetase [Pseudomonadota bacterium]